MEENQPKYRARARPRLPRLPVHPVPGVEAGDGRGRLLAVVAVVVLLLAAIVLWVR